MRIYFTNDMHGHLQAVEWLEREAAPLLRSGEALYLDSGDALLGSHTVWRRREPILERMRSLPCAAMAMGNRELNYLRSVLQLRQKERGFPLLCSNLGDLKVHPHLDLEGIIDLNRSPLELPWPSASSPSAAPSPWVPALTWLTSASQPFNLTLLGATPVQYPPHSWWEPLFRLRFFDPLIVLPPLAKYYSQPPSGKAARLIILSHLGLELDRQLAPLLPEGTWILGGHSHTVLERPQGLGGAMIAQTGSWARHIAQIEYDWDNPLESEYRLLDL